MEYENIKEWMDRQVDRTREQTASKDFNNRIRTSADGNVMFYEGIDIVADIMGIPLAEEIREDARFRYRYSFLYREIEFLQYEKQRLPGFGEEEKC